jgi:hypothetical protein
MNADWKSQKPTTETRRHGETQQDSPLINTDDTDLKKQKLSADKHG